MQVLAMSRFSVIMIEDNSILVSWGLVRGLVLMSRSRPRPLLIKVNQDGFCDSVPPRQRGTDTSFVSLNLGEIRDSKR